VCNHVDLNGAITGHSFFVKKPNCAVGRAADNPSDVALNDCHRIYIIYVCSIISAA